jgi:hypothetical protein
VLAGSWVLWLDDKSDAWQTWPARRVLYGDGTPAARRALE